MTCIFTKSAIAHGLLTFCTFRVLAGGKFPPRQENPPSLRSGRVTYDNRTAGLMLPARLEPSLSGRVGRARFIMAGGSENVRSRMVVQGGFSPDGRVIPAV